MYNSYSFEILIGGYLFKPDDEEMTKQLKKYNFLYFLSHIFYMIADTLGCKCDWPTTRLFHDCREEMVKQLDILYLFRRVSLLEKGVNNLLTDKQVRSLHLLEKRTLLEAKKDRRRFSGLTNCLSTRPSI